MSTKYMPPIHNWPPVWAKIGLAVAALLLTGASIGLVLAVAHRNYDEVFDDVLRAGFFAWMVAYLSGRVEARIERWLFYFAFVAASVLILWPFVKDGF